MRTPFLVIVLAVSSGCASWGRVSKVPTRAVEMQVREKRFPNGLRVLLESDRTSKRVAVVAVVGTGAANDPVGREGIAHFLEHLVFRSQPDGKQQLWDALDLAGAAGVNAGTGLDTTTYYAMGPSSILPRLLQILGTQVSVPPTGVDAATFEVEREVVRNELRQRGETSSMGATLTAVLKAVFPPGHRYARPLAGTHQSLAAITPADVAAYFAAHYRPDNITLAITGDVDPADLDRLLGNNLPPGLLAPRAAGPATFGPRLTGEAPEPPEPPKEALETLEANVPTPELHVVWSLPRGYGADASLQDFLADAVGQVASEVQQRDEDVLEISANLIPGVEGSLVWCTAVLRTGANPEKVKARILDQLVNLWAHDEDGPQDSEAAMARTKAVIVNGVFFQMESIFARAAARAELTHFSGDAAVYGQSVRQLLEASSSKVETMAAKYITRDRARAVVVVPETKSDAKSLANGLGGATSATSVLVPAPPPGVIRAVGYAMDLSDSRQFALANGLRVVLVRRPTMPVVAISLAVPGGTMDARVPGAPDLAAMLARPRVRRGDFASDYGARFSLRPGDDATVLSWAGPSNNAGALVSQVSVYLSALRVDGTMATHAMEEILPIERAIEGSVEAKAERAFASALFRGTRYGYTTTADDLQRLGGGDANAWLASTLAPGGAALVVVGDLDLAAVEAQVTTELSSWSAKAPGDSVAASPADAAAPLRVALFHRPNATQVQTRLGCLVPPSAPGPKAVAARLLAETLGDTLNQTLREQLGSTYGFHGSAALSRLDANTVEVQGAIGVATLGPALAALSKTLAAFRGTKLTEAQVARARWHLARETNGMDQGSAWLAGALATTMVRGGTPENLAAVGQDAATVPLADIQAAWERCQGTMVIQLLGDEAVLKPAVGVLAGGRAP